MIDRLRFVGRTIYQNLFLWWAISLLFTLLYYVVLMVSVMVRFGVFPNYVRFYDWLFNVKTIILSTPSLRDTLTIISEEWLLEIGYMNYDFGRGISEWSLFLLPVKILEVFLLGAIIATLYLLLRQTNRICSPLVSRSSRAVAGVGGTFVALSSITLSWVVCCSTPTWVVGLAMLGLGVSTSLWLEPLGMAVSLIGFSVLCYSLYLASGKARAMTVSEDKA